MFKSRGIPHDSLPDLIVMYLQTAMVLIVFSLLPDHHLLESLMRGEYLKAKGLIGVGVELEGMLSVQQLLISEENICKYDEIVVKKILLSEVQDPIDIDLLPAL